MEENKETVAQEALRLLKEVPAEDFITDKFTDYKGKCCVIGHYQRLKSADPDDYSEVNCTDNLCNPDKEEYETGCKLRNLSGEFLKKVHNIPNRSIAWVNNYTIVNGYAEESIKDRVIHCLEDMVAAGY